MRPEDDTNSPFDTGTTPTGPVEAERFIAFQLGELASRNEHHAFERIATRIARQRISSNILLANGPVSARGDQQRDAESYWTRKPSELPLARAAGAALSADPVVLAATVQKEGLRAKILRDVAGICAPGAEPVERIVFYSVASIDAGLVHKLQKTVHEAHDVRLEVFSGEQVATLLAEPDLIWVATHYLSLPNHLVPRLAPDLHPPQYRALLERLRISGGPEVLTPGAQSEIRDCLRYATWNSEANADLPEWLDFMVAFTDEDENLVHDGVEFGNLAFNACYEIVMARLHGTGSVTRAEDLYRGALGYALSVDRPSVIEDAVVMVSSWASAWRRGRTSAGAQEIAQCQKQLRAHVDRQLDGLGPTLYPGHRACLVAAVVTLSLVPDCMVLERRYGPPPGELVSRTAELADVTVFDAAVFVQWADLDVDEIMRQLRRLVELLPASRSFPIGRIAGTFQLFADAFRHHPDYRLVRDALDDAVVLVRGDGARAERSHERAVSALKADRPIEALGELHDAKASWLHGETMRKAIQAMRLIGRIYASLGLMYAAKQYSLTAASLAVADSDHETKAVTVGALLDAVEYCQRGGSWFDAAGYSQYAVMAHFRMSHNLFEHDDRAGYDIVEANAAANLMAIRKFWPHLEQPFVATFGDNGWIEAVARIADEISDRYTMTEAELHEPAPGLAGPVLGDLGPLRIIDFRALGVRWRLTFHNDLTTVLTAEALCAALQVTLAELAPHEPVLAEVTVDAYVEVVPGGRSVHELGIDRRGPYIRGRVTIPDPEGMAATEHIDSLVSHVFALIDLASPRPAAEYVALVDKLLAAGVLGKVGAARPYEIATGLLEESHYELCAALEPPASAVTFDPVAPEALDSATSHGPGYDREAVLALIRERYATAETSISITLTRLAADPRYPDFVTGLRSQGWLDWQILIAIWNLVGNWRVQHLELTAYITPQQRLDVFDAPEDVTSPLVPLDKILGPDLAVVLEMQVVNIGQTWDLHPVTEARPAAHLGPVLAQRYGYSQDDVEHVDLLKILDADGHLRPLLPPSKP